MTVTTVPQANDTPCGHVVIGGLQIPIFNLSFTPPTREPGMREEPVISPTEQLIRDFAASHSLDYSTVKQIVNDGIMEQPPVMPAESLAKLNIALNSTVLHSTQAKGLSRSKLRKLDRTRKQLGPSKKRTAREREAVASKLREHRRRD